MIRNFGNKIASDIYHIGKSSKIPNKHWKRSIYLLDIMDAVDGLEDLKSKGFPPDVRLHPLKGDRTGEFAIDIHKLDGWRITFMFEKSEFYNHGFSLQN